MSSRKVPLGGEPLTLTCHRRIDGAYCDAPAAWHLSWYDEQLPAGDWENSLACQQHRDDAERQGWEIGWRHRVLPACTLPGSLLHIADEGDDEDGFPISFCAHPFDEAEVAATAEALVAASSGVSS